MSSRGKLKLYPPGSLRKGPNWIIRGTYRGVSIYRSTGSDRKPPASYIRSIEREIDDRIESSPASNRWTFADAVTAYARECPEGELKFVTVLLNHFRDTNLDAIDNAALKDAAFTLYPNASPATRNRQVIAPAAAIIHAAHERGKCAYLKIRRFKEKKPATTYATPDVAAAILSAMRESRMLDAPRIKGLRKGPGRPCYPRACAAFCFLTGRRLGDAMALDWSSVDLEARTVAIARTKNGNPITVAIHGDLLVELANLPHRKGLVFGYKSRRQFLTDWHHACDLLGIERRRSEGGLTPHGMRHSFASWLDGQGKSLRQIMEAGGWESERAAMRYVHLGSAAAVDSVVNLPSIRAKSVCSDNKEAKK